MWLAFTDYKWIEAGTRGPINASDYYIPYWQGHFMAWADMPNEYHERDFQTVYPTGTHNFQISRQNGRWTVYMDYTQVATVPYFDNYTSARDLTVGIESSDTSNSFTNGTYASAMQLRDTSGNWISWSDPGNTIHNTSYNDLGWYDTYSLSNNRLYFYHP